MLLLVLSACQDEPIDKQHFTQVLGDRNVDVSYYPISVRETLDQGAVILAGRTVNTTDFPGVVLIKVDQDGNFESLHQLPGDFVNPIGGLLDINGQYFFFCMNPVNFAAYLVTVNQKGEMDTPIPLSGSISFPLAATAADNQIALLSYNAVDKMTVVSLLQTDGTPATSIAYSIGEGSDADALILNHFSQRKSQMPFQIGTTPSGSYFFNGLYNYTLSLAFTGLSGAPTGIVQGQSTVGGISHILPLSDGTYAVAGFQFEEIFIRPTVSLQEQGISSAIDLMDGNVGEIRANSRISMVEYTLGQATYLIVAAETENRELILYFYDSTGALVNRHTIGYLNAFNLGDLALTADNGLLVLGSTFTAGKYERLYLHRLSEKQLAELL